MSATANELAFAGPSALAELVHRREIRPRELVELYCPAAPGLSSAAIAAKGALGKSTAGRV